MQHIRARSNLKATVKAAGITNYLSSMAKATSAEKGLKFKLRLPNKPQAADLLAPK
jgi:hypothetical protein